MVSDGSDGLSVRKAGRVRDGGSERRRCRCGGGDVSCCFEVEVAVSEEREEVVLHLLVDLALSEEHAASERKGDEQGKQPYLRPSSTRQTSLKERRTRERNATHLLLALAIPLLPVPFTNLLISSPYLSSISSPNNTPSSK